MAAATPAVSLFNLVSPRLIVAKLFCRASSISFLFFVEMLNMAMMSRAKKRKAHLVELNEPTLEKEKKD